MDSYSNSRKRFRRQDAMTLRLRRSLKGTPSKARKDAVARAVSVPLTDKQKAAAK